MQILIGLSLLSLLLGIFYVGATLPPVEGSPPKEEQPVGWDHPACKIPAILYEAIPPRVEEPCSIARGVAERPRSEPLFSCIIRGTELPWRKGGLSRATSDAVRDGLHAALIFKPVRHKRPPVLSSYDFVERWVAGVGAWGVDTSAEPAIRPLMVAWDEGRDARVVPQVSLAGSWDYRAWDGGVRRNVV